MNDTSHTKTLPLIKVIGNDSERGKMAGKSSSKQIAKSLSTYKTTFALCDISWHDAIEKARLHLPVIKDFTPHLLDELHGLAQGCDCATSDRIDFNTLLALNCRTEILPGNFRQRAMAAAGQNINTQNTFANECTSLAVARDRQPVWLAQNWDWTGAQREALIVLHAKPGNHPAYITVSEAGMLAKIGINDKGFAVSLNILRSDDDGQSSGMPVHFLLRALLECSNVEHACELASQLPYASSSNILIADKSGSMANLEISPRGCRIINGNNNQLCHTNHFLHPDFTANDVGVIDNNSTIRRLNTVENNLSDVKNITDIKKLLSDSSDGDESICRYADPALPELAQIETVVAVAMNLTEKTLLVSAAQPSITDFTEHRFNS